MFIKNKTILVLFATLFLTCAFPVLSHAQIDVLPDGGSPDSAPVDGGLSLLVAAGVGYGAKKLKEKKNKASSQDADKL